MSTTHVHVGVMAPPRGARVSALLAAALAAAAVSRHGVSAQGAGGGCAGSAGGLLMTCEGQNMTAIPAAAFGPKTIALFFRDNLVTRLPAAAFPAANKLCILVRPRRRRARG